MDLLLLGAMAVVLIALTLWLVWRPSPETARPEANSNMTPMGDEFEDQYTSATADLSAGGVAITTAGAEESTAWPEATIGPEGSTTEVVGTRPRTPPASIAPIRADVPAQVGGTQAMNQRVQLGRSRSIGMGAAVVLTL